MSLSPPLAQHAEGPGRTPAGQHKRLERAAVACRSGASDRATLLGRSRVAHRNEPAQLGNRQQPEVAARRPLQEHAELRALPL